MANGKDAKREYDHKRYLAGEFMGRDALTPALSRRRGRKPINPFSCRAGENRSIPSPSGQGKTDQSLLPQDRGKPINPFSCRTGENRSIPSPSGRRLG
jgi:hypothetical protein